MSNLVPTNLTIPAHIANRINKPSALSTNISGGLSSGESVPRISLKGSRFRIKDGDAETVLSQTEIDVVIIGANPRLSKTWYAAAWDPNAEPTAPDCFSLDGIRPSPESTDIQNDVCATCPHNAWGSKIGPQGQKLKSCSDTKRLAVVPADDPAGKVYLLGVTPAALKDLNVYQKQLTMRGIAPEIVKTRLSFDTNASFPKLQFGFGGFLDEDGIAAVDARLGADEVLAITGEKVQSAPVIEAPTPAPKPVSVKVKEEAPAQTASEPAPTTVKGFGGGAPVASEPAAEQPAKQAESKPKVVSSGNSLADEIANMLGEMSADDE